jgi:hypothetical protein
VVIDPDFCSLKDFHDLPPFVFGFDSDKPPEVSIMYPFHIYINFGPLNGWPLGKINHNPVTYINW